MKSLIAAASVAAMLVAAPAFAMECTDAEMKSMNGKIDGMAAGEGKTMAMDHMKMAKDSMAKKDDKECAMHMKQAMDSMDGKMDKMDKMDKK